MKKIEFSKKQEGLWKEFKKFIARGNVLDLAIGVILGSAFSGIVNTIVNSIFMPLFTIIVGKGSFNKWFIALNGQHYKTIEAAKNAGVAVINFGALTEAILNFFIIAISVFLFVKFFQRLKIAKKAEDAVTKECPFCCSNIPQRASRCPQCTSRIAQS